jgi:hypothetical protein
MNLRHKSDKLLISELKELKKREREAKRMKNALLREAKRRQLDRVPAEDLGIVAEQRELLIRPAGQGR